MGTVRVEMLLGAAKTEELAALQRFIDFMQEQINSRCKYCGSFAIVRNGKSRKGVQNWLCRDCGKAFVDNQALPRMKSSMEQLGSALLLYYSGISLNKIRQHSCQQYGNMPSEATVYNWVTQFTEKAIKEADKFTPSTGDSWVADETMIDVAGTKLWLIDILDEQTRFLLATRLSKERGKKDIALLLRKAYVRSGMKAPKRILTDGWKVYPDAVDLVFGRFTKHVASRPFVEVDSTNIIERFQGSIKERTKVMRGFKRVESARLILDGWSVFYNFFRPHESLEDKTPSEAAGIKFPFKNWLEIVKVQAPIPTANNAEKFAVLSTEMPFNPVKRHLPRRRNISRFQAKHFDDKPTQLRQARI